MIYETNEHNIIISPGKFEGECRYVPYFWDKTMEGAEDETIYDGETPVSVFKIAPEDIATYPELTEYSDSYLLLFEDGMGFVNSSIMDAGELAAFQEECKPSFESEEEDES